VTARFRKLNLGAYASGSVSRSRIGKHGSWSAPISSPSVCNPLIRYSFKVSDDTATRRKKTSRPIVLSPSLDPAAIKKPHEVAQYPEMWRIWNDVHNGGGVGG
jgi:hypothetical protein